jgi:excisionase family DNA binding protein
MGQMISVIEAADRLGVHHKTIRRLINTGELPAVKVASVVRIDVDDLDRVCLPIVPSGAV